MTDKIEKKEATFAMPYNGEDNNDYVDGKGFCCNDGSLEAAQARALSRAAKNNFQEGDAYEKMQFYYHPDHLGSSSQPYKPGGSANTGISSVNVNSTRDELIRAYPHQESTLRQYPANSTLKSMIPTNVYKTFKIEILLFTRIVLSIGSSKMNCNLRRGQLN